jgi:hypothetical protein
LRKPTSIPQSSVGRKTTKPKQTQQPVLQQNGRTSKVDNVFKLKSSGDNVRSPPKLEIDESILAAAVAAEEGNNDETVDIVMANLEDLAAKRQRDRDEANRVLLDAEKHREIEAKEEEEQRLFEELERLTAEEDEEEMNVYSIAKEIMMEAEINHEELRPEMIPTDEEDINAEDDVEQTRVDRLEPEEIEDSDQNDESAKREEEDQEIKKKQDDKTNEELTKKEDMDKEQMIQIKHEEVAKRIQAEKEEEIRRAKEEQERAERRKRLDMIMQRARNRAAGSPPATIKSFGQVAESGLSSLLSEQQSPPQSEGVVVFSTDDEDEKSKEQVELIELAPVQLQSVEEQNGGESSAESFVMSSEILADIVANDVVLEVESKEKDPQIELKEGHGEQNKIDVEMEVNVVQAEEARFPEEASDKTEIPAQDNDAEDANVLEPFPLSLTQLSEEHNSCPPDLPVSLPPDLPVSAPPDLPVSAPPDLPSLSPPALPKSLPPNCHESVPLVSPDLPVGSLVQSSSLSPEGLSPVCTARNSSSFQQEEWREQEQLADSDLGNQVAEDTSNMGEPLMNEHSLHGSSPVTEDDEQEAGLADSGAEIDVGEQRRDSGISDEEASSPLPQLLPPNLERTSNSSFPVLFPVENVEVSPPLTLLELSPSAIPDSDSPSRTESPPPALPNSLPPALPDSPPPALPDSLPPNLPVTNLPNEVESAIEAETSLDSEAQRYSQMNSCVEEERQSQYVTVSSLKDASITPAVIHMREEDDPENANSDILLDTADIEEPLWKNIESVLESTIPFVLEAQNQIGQTGEKTSDQEEHLWRTVESVTSKESNVGPLPVRREQLAINDVLPEDNNSDDEGVV